MVRTMIRASFSFHQKWSVADSRKVVFLVFRITKNIYPFMYVNTLTKNQNIVVKCNLPPWDPAESLRSLTI